MKDLYQTVTDKIIASLEAGVVPWVRPWVNAPHGGQPYNAASGKRYRGINVALLYAPECPTAAWLTFKQAKDLGAHVRKGEHGTKIVFFKAWKVRDANADDGEERTIPVLREFTVFNVAQIDGLPESMTSPIPEPAETPDDRSAAFARMIGLATVRHGGDRAFYSPTRDFIQMPRRGLFKTPENYQGTALHELTHWTGHTSRLAREYGKRFGDTAYAREELVAEMGSAFLCAAAEIDGQLQHPEYIASWLKVLKNDKRAIIHAASAAQKAADYVLTESGLQLVEQFEEQAQAA